MNYTALGPRSRANDAQRPVVLVLGSWGGALSSLESLRHPFGTSLRSQGSAKPELVFNTTQSPTP